MAPQMVGFFNLVIFYILKVKSTYQESRSYKDRHNLSSKNIFSFLCCLKLIRIRHKLTNHFNPYLVRCGWALHDMTNEDVSFFPFRRYFHSHYEKT